MELNEIKKLIHQQLTQLIEFKIKNAQEAIAAAEESRDNETKSSVGDKYETGRAMMQIEVDRNKAQLINAVELKNELSQINILKEYDKAELGSLIITNQGNYFLSVGLGKIEIGKEKYYAISMASPMGQSLQHKQAGDRVKFLDKEIIIKKIY